MMNKRLTGLRVLCSLKVSSRTADWSLDSLSFFRQASPPYSSSSSEVPREEDRSKAMSRSSPAPEVPSLSVLLLPLTVLEIVLFGDETPVSSSKSTVVGKLFTSIFLRNCWFWWSADMKMGHFEILFMEGKGLRSMTLYKKRSVPEEETKVWFHGNIWRLDIGEEVGFRSSWRGWWFCANPKLRLKPRSSFPIIMI